MFSFPGIVSLVFFFFVRPHEVFELLQQLPLLYIFTALAVFGMVIDLRLRLVRPEPTPQLAWALLFFAWAALSAALRHPDPPVALLDLAILFTWYFLISHGLQSLRAFDAMARLLVGLAVFLAAVGVHQHFAPLGCVAAEPDVNLAIVSGAPDGRSCRTASDCLRQGADPGKEYVCEHVGLLGTTTISDRVRYRGTLQDPNELASVIASVLPLIIALITVRPSAGRWLGGLIGGALILLCVVLTRSRGGLMGVGAALSVYVIRRFRLKGVAALGLLTIPLMYLVLSNRADADASSIERMECWWEGMNMFRYHPFFGVGFDQFTEHHYLTAHNSFVLTVAELGIVGMLLWVGLLYVSCKIPIVAYLRYPDQPEVRAWALATLAAFGSTMVGAFFLSLTYRYMPWTFIALCGSLYRAIKAHDPTWRMPLGARDWLAIGGLTLGLTGGLFVITRMWMASN
ncbi:MAG: O-antigen ligase family protein [Proteobacteria bacterium]|nr:O-antigen ligase family protein [Pseudomonadota bacterium]